MYTMKIPQHFEDLFYRQNNVLQLCNLAQASIYSNPTALFVNIERVEQKEKRQNKTSL